MKMIVAYSKHKGSKLVSGLIISFIVLNKYIEDIIIAILSIWIIVI